MSKLSIVIITKNEAHNIARCIKSCLPLYAEIIVLDSQSTDNTVSIAEGLGAKVISVTWEGYGATKNKGAQLATHNWILSLDADEALNEALQLHLQELIRDVSKISNVAYWLPRTLVIGQKQLNFGAVRKESRLRLYRKDILAWNNNKVHEELRPIDNRKEWSYGKLEGSLLHYSYTDVADMKKRLEKYAQLSAEHLVKKTKTYLYLKKLTSPAFSFLFNYIVNLGLADGYYGFQFAWEQARYAYKKYDYALRAKS